ncbi:DUF4352 domain-containing protein [Acidianus sp. HS-5]|uniref:DUF4352 domain-containing protein n=1 Tax=Acidianus sp. HS-5 TaxID=2886040 RepID=UPI001F428BBB|nr:DUF4352 domain-containing protein [Acidianus sp. HS-5]BDC18798.1 hypothetical protein HS5_16880 [Acidianus sp. HS-5]
MNKVVIIGVVVAVIVVIAAIAVLYKPTSTTPSTTTTTPSSTTPPSPYELSIINVINGHALSEYDGESGKTFVIVNFTFNYEGSSSFTVKPSDFYIITNEGEYEACFTSLFEGTPNYLSEATLQKGDHISGCIAFEIPTSATPEKIEYKTLTGNVLVCTSLPSPNKYIIAIGDVYACTNNDSIATSLITHPTLPANIFTYGGEIQNYTIKVTAEDYFGPPVKITAVKVSPSCFTVVSCGGAVGKELSPGQCYCFTVSIKYPADGGYFKSVYIYVCVECT